MASLASARERLRELEVDGVVETGKRLGSGSYGVVMEMKVRGLRSVYYCSFDICGSLEVIALLIAIFV